MATATATATRAMADYPLTHQGVRDLNQRPLPARGGRVNVGPHERAASTLVGAVVAGFGTSCGTLCGLLMAAAGGALVYRGVTGHCSAYAATGVNTAG